MTRYKHKCRLPWNWRSRLEIYKNTSVPTNLKNTLIEGMHVTLFLCFKKGQTPRGFRTRLGYMVFSRWKPYFVYDVMLYNERLYNHGLGLLLYKAALHHRGMLSTNFDSASGYAQRVWLSLCRRYPHKFKGPILHIWRRNYNGKLP